jgi:hypothetical protein
MHPSSYIKSSIVKSSQSTSAPADFERLNPIDQSHLESNGFDRFLDIQPSKVIDLCSVLSTSRRLSQRVFRGRVVSPYMYSLINAPINEKHLHLSYNDCIVYNQYDD